MPQSIDPDDTTTKNWGVDITPRQNTGIVSMSGDDADDDAEMEQPEDRIAHMLNVSRNEARAIVKLYRPTGKGKTLAWCADYSPSDFESVGFEGIRVEFGPGSYHVRLLGPGPSGRQVVLAKTDIEIVPRASDSDRPQQNQQSSGFEAILRAMQEQNSRVLEALTNSRQADPMAQMEQTVKMLTMLREVGGNSTAPANSLADTIKTIRDLREMATELNPQKEAAEADVLTTTLPSIIGLVQTAMTQRQPLQALPNTMPAVSLPTSMQQPIAQPAPQEAPASNVTNTPPAGTDPMNLFQLLKLQALVATLLQMAQTDAAIEPAAELLLTELPDELQEMLEMDNWFSQLSQATSGMGVDITPHQAWLTRVRDYIKTLPMEDEAA